MAESLAACTEHQGNDTPHIHGLMAIACPYQYKTLLEIRNLIEHDVTEFDRIKRFIEHMCREDHFDNEAHQDSLPSLEKAKNEGLAGAPHFRLSAKPSFLQPRRMPATQPSLWDTILQKESLTENKLQENTCPKIGWTLDFIVMLVRCCLP